MPISVSCPACSQELAVQEGNAGQQLRCPRCQTLFHPADLPLVAPAPSPLAASGSSESSTTSAAEAGTHTSAFAPAPAEAALPPRYIEAPGGAGLALTATILLAITAVLNLVAVLQAVVLLNLLEADRGFVLGGRAQEEASTLSLVRMMQVALFLGTTVVFLTWTWQAYDNLERLDVEGLQHTPAWAVAWFFIPVMNLVRPVQVFQEIWRASSPQILSGRDWKQEPAGAVNVWWVFLVIATALAGISQYTALTPPRLPDDGHLRSVALFTIASNVVGVVAALLSIVVVHGVTNHQQEKLEALVGHDTDADEDEEGEDQDAESADDPDSEDEENNGDEENAGGEENVGDAAGDEDTTDVADENQTRNAGQG
jgi:hypothetical protein